MNAHKLIVLLCIYTGNTISIDLSTKVLCLEYLFFKELIIVDYDDTSTGYSCTFKGKEFLHTLLEAFNN